MKRKADSRPWAGLFVSFKASLPLLLPLLLLAHPSHPSSPSLMLAATDFREIVLKMLKLYWKCWICRLCAAPLNDAPKDGNPGVAASWNVSLVHICTADLVNARYSYCRRYGRPLAGAGKSKTNNTIKSDGRLKTGALCHENLGEILQMCWFIEPYIISRKANFFVKTIWKWPIQRCKPLTEMSR